MVIMKRSEIKLYNKDCFPEMKKMNDNEYDLAIIDCEYGINQGGDRNHTRSKRAISKKYHSFNDSESPDIEYFNELMRVSKNQIIWGANHFISKIPFDSPSWIVWDKDNGENDFADAELAYTSFNGAVRIFKFRWAGMLQGNMKNKEKRIHPTQKPVQLYKWTLMNYAKKR
jgi:site-specific DNA-methyltransferase (adenine-specific)